MIVIVVPVSRTADRSIIISLVELGTAADTMRVATQELEKDQFN
jgi:hypothetical protein